MKAAAWREQNGASRSSHFDLEVLESHLKFYESRYEWLGVVGSGRVESAVKNAGAAD